MVEKMTKAQLLHLIEVERSQWDLLISPISEANMVKPGAAGDWSIKDIISHIVWHEKQMVDVLQERVLAGSDWWNLPLDERNALIYEGNRHRPLQEVLTESKHVYDQLISLIQNLSDEELNDHKWYRDMPPEFVPWKMLAENTYEHYHDHIPSVREWLSRVM